MRGVDEGVLVVLDADEETAEEWRDGQRDDGDHHDGEAEPQDKGVPLPRP